MRTERSSQIAVQQHDYLPPLKHAYSTAALRRFGHQEGKLSGFGRLVRKSRPALPAVPYV